MCTDEELEDLENIFISWENEVERASSEHTQEYIGVVILDQDQTPFDTPDVTASDIVQVVDHGWG